MSDASHQTTSVDGDVVTFRVPDPEHALGGVRLWTDLDLPLSSDFGPTDAGWELTLTGLPLDRIEYLLEIDGELGTDAGNPLLVAGAFGDHSWLPLAGYLDPPWLALEPVQGERTGLTGAVTGELWTPAGISADVGLPLLISHDGPEMDAYGHLTRYVGALVAAGRLPPMRVALLPPGQLGGQRNEEYAANPEYAAHLVEEVLPAIGGVGAIQGRPVLMGQSLGAVAALHAAWTHPGVFAGLFLQSGSFFTPETDPQESDFEQWPQITRFVAELEPGPGTARSITLVCGTAEENLANNRLMAERLRTDGVEVHWGEVRDGHNWTCWRDLLDPHLTDLLASVWS
ncbi:alpha/beta hydrolase [Nocardioides sp.]|uniref:alpha/beta hydrolase n=1 Tax=Nocardioides sp. TaxID=35761 RepID=UPI003D0A1940